MDGMPFRGQPTRGPRAFGGAPQTPSRKGRKGEIQRMYNGYTTDIQRIYNGYKTDIERKYDGATRYQHRSNAPPSRLQHALAPPFRPPTSRPFCLPASPIRRLPHSLIHSFTNSLTACPRSQHQPPTAPTSLPLARTCPNGPPLR
jgi:hypothetical protein